MKLWEWMRLTWCESRLGRYASGVHRLQAEDLRVRTRRHVHDVADAILATREVALELERILAGMKEERRDTTGRSDDVDGSGAPPPPEPGSG